MEIKYKVMDDKFGNEHGTFDLLEDARETAQEVANDLLLDVYIERLIIDCIEWYYPELDEE